MHLPPFSLITSLPLPFPLLLLLLCPHIISASTINYINYQPAVNIVIANSGPGDSAGAPSPGGGGSPPITPTAVPFSPASAPICPASHISCDTIGEPSWCCTGAQHCAFDEGGSVACCPVGKSSSFTPFLLRRRAAFDVRASFSLGNIVLDLRFI